MTAKEMTLGDLVDKMVRVGSAGAFEDEFHECVLELDARESRWFALVARVEAVETDLRNHVHEQSLVRDSALLARVEKLEARPAEARAFLPARRPLDSPREYLAKCLSTKNSNQSPTGSTETGTKPTCECKHAFTSHFESGVCGACGPHGCEQYRAASSPPPEPAKANGTTVVSDAFVDAVRRWDSVHCAEDDGCCSLCARLHREIAHFDMEPCDAPVTPAPTPGPAKEEGWTTLGELKPGDVFEFVQDGPRWARSIRLPDRVGDVCYRGLEAGEGQARAVIRVRRLRIAAPGDIVFDPADAALFKYVASVIANAPAHKSPKETAERVIESLRARGR